MKKIPSVYANKIEKELKNNERVYFSKNDNEKNKILDDTQQNKKTIDLQIKELFQSTNYIYKVDVEIKTKDGILNKRIIGRNSNNLITMDNELIPIDQILEIKNKNE